MWIHIHIHYMYMYIYIYIYATTAPNIMTAWISSIAHLQSFLGSTCSSQPPQPTLTTCTCQDLETCKFGLQGGPCRW